MRSTQRRTSNGTAIQSGASPVRLHRPDSLHPTHGNARAARRPARRLSSHSRPPRCPHRHHRGNQQISGLDATMEYSTDGKHWTKVNAADLNNAVLSNLEAGEYQVRYAAVTGENAQFASESAAVTVTDPYIPPNPSYLITVADSEDGAVTSSHTAAKKGDTVTLTVHSPRTAMSWKRLPSPTSGARTWLSPTTATAPTPSPCPLPGEVEASFTQTEKPELPFTDVTEADWFYDEGVLRLGQRAHDRRLRHHLRPQRHHHPCPGGHHSVPSGRRARSVWREPGLPLRGRSR